MRKRRQSVSTARNARWVTKTGVIIAVSVVVLAGALFGALSACGKPSAQTTPPGTAGLFSDPDDSAHPRDVQKTEKKYELDARGKELLLRVKDGDDVDVSRFAAYVGAAGLMELSRAEETRALSLAAMEWTPGFSCAALLAETAKQGKDDDARISLRSLHGIAARHRKAVDLEDRAELTYTCDTLLEVARDDRRKERADQATSVLRMLGTYGCAIPEAGAAGPAVASPVAGAGKDLDAGEGRHP